MNTPPFTVTPSAVRLIAEISHKLGRLEAGLSEDIILKLRRLSRIRTVQGTLSIEGNSLSEEEVTALLNGKRVIATAKEILEIENAYRVYDAAEELDPKNIKDLLKAHKLMMQGLLKDAGKFRREDVGVIRKTSVIHVAPPSAMVPELMKNLFQWLKKTDQHPLITCSVFHYEFEFIHPFEDGNGRVGRLWQSLILGKWNSFFFQIPIESMTAKNQEEYYSAIRSSTKKGDSAVFIEYMLRMILEAVDQITPEVGPQVTPEVRKLTEVMETISPEKVFSRNELQEALGLKDPKHFREQYLQPAIRAGLIEMTLPGKPNSRFQKYHLIRFNY